MSVLYAQNLLPPLEEGLRDLASSDLAGSMTTIIETVLEPSALEDDAVCDDDTQPLDFEMLWVAAKDGLADDETGALSRVALGHPGQPRTVDVQRPRRRSSSRLSLKHASINSRRSSSTCSSTTRLA